MADKKDDQKQAELDAQLFAMLMAVGAKEEEPAPAKPVAQPPPKKPNGGWGLKK